MKMKPMLCDETEDQNPGGGFAASREQAPAGKRVKRVTGHDA